MRKSALCVCVVSQSSPPPIFSLLSVCNSPSLPSSLSPSLPSSLSPSLPLSLPPFLPLSPSLLPPPSVVPSLLPSLSPPFFLSPDARGTMPSRASLPCSPPEEWTPPSSSPRCAGRRGVGQGSRRGRRGPFQPPRTKHHVSVCVCVCVRSCDCKRMSNHVVCAGPCLEFAPFLPLEIFDDTEYDCRTPEGWMALRLEREGEGEVRKLVPAKALLPSLVSLVGEEGVVGMQTPLPPAGAPPPGRRVQSGGREWGVIWLAHTFRQHTHTHAHTRTHTHTHILRHILV